MTSPASGPWHGALRGLPCLVWSRAAIQHPAMPLSCTSTLGWINKWIFWFFAHVPTFVTDKEQMIGLLAICVRENRPHRACILEASVL